MMNDPRSNEKGPGASGFLRQYWQDNYAEPELMDGVYNARARAQALKAFFDAEYIEMNSLIDFGFGLGHLFAQMIDVFRPHTVVGIEPSTYAFAQVSQQRLSTIESTDITLLQTDLRSWSLAQPRADHGLFDLGICTSVFQYLSDVEIKAVLPVMAQRVRFLYFAVPTDEELRYQARELNFDDTYALSRSAATYRTFLAEHFTIVSYRLLESKVHFDANTTLLSDLFYRF